MKANYKAKLQVTAEGTLELVETTKAFNRVFVCRWSVDAVSELKDGSLWLDGSLTSTKH